MFLAIARLLCCAQQPKLDCSCNNSFKQGPGPSVCDRTCALSGFTFPTEAQVLKYVIASSKSSNDVPATVAAPDPVAEPAGAEPAVAERAEKKKDKRTKRWNWTSPEELKIAFNAALQVNIPSLGPSGASARWAQVIEALMEAFDGDQDMRPINPGSLREGMKKVMDAVSSEVQAAADENTGLGDARYEAPEALADALEDADLLAAVTEYIGAQETAALEKEKSKSAKKKNREENADAEKNMFDRGSKLLNNNDKAKQRAKRNKKDRAASSSSAASPDVDPRRTLFDNGNVPDEPDEHRDDLSVTSASDDGSDGGSDRGHKKKKSRRDNKVGLDFLDDDELKIIERHEREDRQRTMAFQQTMARQQQVGAVLHLCVRRPCSACGGPACKRGSRTPCCRSTWLTAGFVFLAGRLDTDGEHRRRGQVRSAAASLSCEATT